MHIVYPSTDFQIRTEQGTDYIFDALRKCWLVLTEEEWVRQNFVQLLVKTMNYPSSLIALEKEIRLGELKKRFDVLVYDREHQPWMMIECKGRNVDLSERVFSQILRYNISVPVRFMVITNGHFTRVWEKDPQRLIELQSLPGFPV